MKSVAQLVLFPSRRSVGPEFESLG
jgi:hypothetical protein